jgi:hypothetical protein
MRAFRPLVLFLCCAAISACGTMPAIHMKFLDEENNQPIVGAHVLFHGSAFEPTLTGHGGERVNLFLVEAVTDDAGEIHLAALEFWPYRFILGTNYNNPSMNVFKDGYALVTLMNDRRIIAERQDVTTWQYNDQTIKMRRVTSSKDVWHSVYWAVTFADETFRNRDKDICSWKKIPQFLVVVDRSAKEWNRKRYAAEEEHLRRWQIESPLQGLLGNEKYYMGKGCGSPRMFFDPYLQNTNR